MKKTKSKSHQFTKDEISTVINLWTSKTTEEIANNLGINVQQVNYITTQIRKTGYRLPKKHKIGHLRNLIEEVIKEIKAKK